MVSIYRDSSYNTIRRNAVPTQNNAIFTFLPREIRNQVHDYVLLNNGTFHPDYTTITIYPKYGGAKNPQDIVAAANKNSYLGWVMSCKDVYHEVAERYYKKLTFCFPDEETFLTFFHRKGGAAFVASNIRHLDFQITRKMSKKVAEIITRLPRLESLTLRIEEEQHSVLTLCSIFGHLSDIRGVKNLNFADTFSLHLEGAETARYPEATTKAELRKMDLDFEDCRWNQRFWKLKHESQIANDDLLTTLLRKRVALPRTRKNRPRKETHPDSGCWWYDGPVLECLRAQEGISSDKAHESSSTRPPAPELKFCFRSRGLSTWGFSSQ